jgi:hypothetical protein
MSSNKDKKREFETDDTGVSIALFDGDKNLVDFVAGKNGSDFTSNYIAKKDSAETL